MTNGTEAGRGSVLIIAEQNADLKLDEVERRGVNAIRAGSSDKLDIAPLGEGESGKRLALCIDEPIEGNAMIRIDAALLKAVAAAGISICNDLADPVGPKLNGIVIRENRKAIPSPTSKVRLNDLVHRESDRRFADDPPATGPGRAVWLSIEFSEESPRAALSGTVSQSGKRLLHDLTVENFMPAPRLWNEEQIGKSSKVSRGSLRRRGGHRRNVALGRLAVKSLGRRQERSVRCQSFAVRKPAWGHAESYGHTFAGIDAGDDFTGFGVAPGLDADSCGGG